MRREHHVAGFAADQSEPGVGRAVVGRHADRSRIEPNAAARSFYERYPAVTGDEDISVGPLEFIGDGRALAGEDKAIDPREAAVDHLSGEACHGEA